jgi:hypothetical protein
MIYLSGVIRKHLRHPMLGFMNTPQMKNKMPHNAPWGADNGRFSNPDAYTDDGYLGWLKEQPGKRCLFAVAPDVLGDHKATVELSLPLLPRLRNLGYQAAFVAQDGWSEHNTPWGEFDVLFIGGTTGFKLGRGACAIAAGQARGKWIHMGRVNSFSRLRVAAALGCNSVDGTFLKYAPDINEPRMLRWFDELNRQPLLRLWGNV